MFSEELIVEISNVFPCPHPPEDTQYLTFGEIEAAIIITKETLNALIR